MQPLEAKEFFVSKIVTQARREGRPLDELDQKMIRFTETGSDACQEYLSASDAFDKQERDEEEFEARVAELLKHAYGEDLAQAKPLRREKEVVEEYRQAYLALGQEDHYILVMIGEALGSQLRAKFLGLF